MQRTLLFASTMRFRSYQQGVCISLVVDNSVQGASLRVYKHPLQYLQFALIALQCRANRVH